MWKTQHQICRQNIRHQKVLSKHQIWCQNIRSGNTGSVATQFWRKTL